MASGADKPLSTTISLPAILVVVLASAYPAFHGVYWAIPVTAAATATGIGVWKAVQLLGLMLNHLHWRDIEVPAADD
ncbi:hypothetical protein EEZ25_31725 [Micromonospora aurantiaca]|uniref:hypothetical protein n=1 Tax=Micromonospora aurantiaca (nom. illeg.) TaxID=47850 RepID=UPI000F404503|nr:hypothetical protein [Micromonospora aurantiaca]RNH94192.1 hypothetical protein EEZ25_31725 [Micromonospora aurantiaca]